MVQDARRGRRGGRGERLRSGPNLRALQIAAAVVATCAGLTACVGSRSVQCDTDDRSYVCAPGMTCWRGSCAMPALLAACDNGEAPDGQSCEYIDSSLDAVCWNGLCTPSSGTCGNGIVELNGSVVEDCDGALEGYQTCEYLGFSGGTLACSDTCEYDTSACTGQCPGVCTAGDQETGDSCGQDGHLVRTCEAWCAWSPWTCQSTAPCEPGATESGGSCGNCGTLQRTCDQSNEWGDWECTDEGVCTPDDTASCGDCGTKTCTGSCTWGSCQDEGVCSPGTTSSTSCGDCPSGGTKTRSCKNDCTWGSYGSCSSDTCTTSERCFHSECVAPPSGCSLRIWSTSGHLYAKCPSTTWNTAEVTCHNWTYSGGMGYLTTINSDNEDDYLHTWVDSTYWIGLRAVNGVDFVWDGPTTTHTNWCPGEPTGTNEDCVASSWCADPPEGWNNVGCGGPYPYFCELN